MDFDFKPLGRRMLTCKNESGRWSIAPSSQANFVHANFQLPMPEGENIISMMAKLTKDSGGETDFDNDSNLFIWAHCSPQDNLITTPTVDHMKRLIPLMVANDGVDDWEAYLLANGFKREENYAMLGIPCYKLELKKGVITVHERNGFDMCYEGFNSHHWWSFFNVSTSNVHYDKSVHPNYFPAGCTNPNGVAAKFMLEEIIPWVRDTKITHKAPVFENAK